MNVSVHNNSGRLVNLTSANGSWRATVSTVGASLLSLSRESQAIVVNPETSFYNFAGAILAPWANRLQDGAWSLDGEKFQAEINEVRTNCANHGYVFDREFTILASNQDSVTFQISLGEDQGYLFKVDLEVKYFLDDDGLRCEMLVTNLEHGRRLPIVLGAHPYFVADSNSQLKVSASFASTNNERQLPVGKTTPESIGVSGDGFTNLADLNLDDCFSGLNFDADEHVTILTRPSFGNQIAIWQKSDFKYQMIFITRNNTGTFVAIEPQTSPANALNSGEDLLWLEPNLAWTSSWGIKIENGLK